ncbi:hypothetical protein ES707_06139 [subsurface metagenome]
MRGHGISLRHIENAGGELLRDVLDPLKLDGVHGPSWRNSLISAVSKSM